MRLVFVVLLGLVLAVTVSFLLGRRGLYVATAALVVGAAIAFVSTIITGCSQCWTEALAVGAFASAPFFVVGWLALSQAEIAAGQRRLLLGTGGLGLFQLVWAARLSLVATVENRCPCGGHVYGLIDTELGATGFDRLVGPWFMAEAIITLAIVLGAYRRTSPQAPRA
ncbi:hypothetical protein QNA08_02090 [Chelatococcus sp. SYSU_G07232]|uniref:Disulfide bond formation protein B n=1 Tax=Chelatococcus albus TaxID=3047466 RepID=A0ABT7AE01_9HYPH|nr:hypothetical protein [Chelatococcus sp. SYSU_G07232]MDJ1157029.1 hypothetical protein [Chelatococcus sp. SYSU_G07232]